MKSIQPNQFFTACTHGDIATATQFIEQQMHPIDIRSEQGWTGLIMACFNEHKELAKLLIQNGSDINATNAKGTTVFMYAKTPVQSNQENTDFLAYLLEQGANINALDQLNKSVLDYVIDNKALSLAEWLIEKGAKRSTGLMK